ncbi:hypothetical protein C7477_107107 [Phyllobacterium leguminum]|uniref:NADH-quinone oxidoreductase subunit A n=1 Tax=Phyllobacterium leguminum TaxID=314237 RepID=A0A318TBS3_9HYPH|nr:hypothetical protein C7477_107107 [Phyllobacterium leguminum]
MTLFELYAFFGAPLLVLAMGFGVSYFTRPKDRLHPGE